jgi:hypothetical protein
MNKYLQSILVFDLAFPALLLGLPCCALLWAGLWIQSSGVEKAEEHSAYEIQNRQVAALSGELQPMGAKIALLKTLLSADDIESKLGNGISAGLDKLTADDIEQTLHDFQVGPSDIGTNFGEGRRLSLKLSSRWEALNIATATWETRFPNMVLESLTIDFEPGTTVSPPYLQSALSYFVVTEN